MRTTLSFLIFISSFQFSFGQMDTLIIDSHKVPIKRVYLQTGPTIDPGWDTTAGPGTDMKRLKLVISGEVVATTGTMLALSQIWYKDFQRISFHTFDDSKEWLQMDKAGHVVTSYYIGKAGIGMLKWCGVKPWKAAVFGGSLGLIYQSGLEILDGYSSGWGFSWSDMAANATGTVLCTGQELLWHQQRITLKVSDHNSKYAKYRPEELGNSNAQQVFKDYNGQTYWLSVNIYSFLRKGFDGYPHFPRWLNVAFGYGAEGMTGGSFNPDFNSAGEHIPTFERYRKCYFSLDADLWRIKTKSKFLKTVLSAIGFIKIPFPALEFSKNGVSFKPLYF